MNQPPVLTDKALSPPTPSQVHDGVDAAAAGPTLSSVAKMASAAHSTVDKLASSASHVADRFAGDARRVKDAPSEALAYSKSWVQNKPLEAVGAALAIGFLIGRLMR